MKKRSISYFSRYPNFICMRKMNATTWLRRPFLWALLFLIVGCTQSLFSQSFLSDSIYIKKLYNNALSNNMAYRWLEDVCYRVGHRISGSEGAEKAVRWSKATLDTLGLDSVWLQPVMVPHWVRGAKEAVYMLSGGQSIPLSALALGGSVGTAPKGLEAQVVEVTSWEALEQYGEAGLKGKIVFYNRPMDPTRLRTFDAYGGAVDQRSQGASRAARYGAVGVLVRSMGLRLDDYPHTGAMHYDSAYALIPAAAISTQAAELLSATLKQSGNVQINMTMSCQTLPDVLSYNVIGEIRGTDFPDRVLLVGGHLDSWDVGHGAHDDGAGCTQSMEVLYLLKKSGYRPRHTIRCVLFMNEENGLRGGKVYAKEAERKKEFHVLALESDAGGFTPRHFSFEGDEAVIKPFYDKISRFEPLFKPYGLEFVRGGSGADISPLRGMKGLLGGYMPDSQRYFDYHHTAADVFEAVNQRELALGAASMAALVYLLDRYGL